MSFNSGLYDEISIQTSYLGFGGLAQMPLAGDESNLGDSCAIVKTSRAYGQKVVAWRIRKTGGMPKLPHPDTGNPNEVFNDFKLSPFVPGIMADGITPCIQAEGVYFYLLKKPPWPGVDNFAMGTMPIGGIPGQLCMLTPADFDRSILAGDNTPPKPHQDPPGLPTVIPAN
jgi:hypothetical protein